MKPSEIIPVLRIALENKYPILLTSSPGIGKSEIITQVVKELGYDLAIEHPVISDPCDAKGLPAIVNGKADFMPYGNLRRMMETTTPLSCFIDDLGQSPNSVQASYMQLLLAREIGGKKISNEVRFIAATNGRKDQAGVSGIITPLINRFYAILQLDINVEDWCKWAFNNNVPVELISFAQFRPELLEKGFNEKSGKELKAYATPRSVKFLGDWMNKGVMDVGIWSGCVGEAFATEFSGFYKIWKEVGNLIPQILMNPKKARIPDEKPDHQYAVCAALAYKATEGNIDSIGTYLDRFENGEFRVFTWKCLTARDKSLCNTASFQSWSIKHSEELQ